MKNRKRLAYSQLRKHIVCFRRFFFSLSSNREPVQFPRRLNYDEYQVAGVKNTRNYSSALLIRRRRLLPPNYPSFFLTPSRSNDVVVFSAYLTHSLPLDQWFPNLNWREKNSLNRFQGCNSDYPFSSYTKQFTPNFRFSFLTQLFYPFLSIRMGSTFFFSLLCVHTCSVNNI